MECLACKKACPELEMPTKESSTGSSVSQRKKSKVAVFAISHGGVAEFSAKIRTANQAATRF
jgi:hypothetical protein